MGETFSSCVTCMNDDCQHTKWTRPDCIVLNESFQLCTACISRLNEKASHYHGKMDK